VNRYLYYPGCSVKGTGRAYEESLLAVFESLGLELAELEDWNCCGATAYMSVDEAQSVALAGRNLALAEPHGLDRPVLMDAELDQTHGFRFMYVLPLTAQRLLLEDTYFHQSPDLDVEGIRAEIMVYAERKGYKIASLVREEQGVLPMTWSGSLPEQRPPGAIAAGFQGGWFHPATGYSLPIAARVADHVAARSPEEAAKLGLDELVPRQRSQSRFCHLLNRLLFRWYAPRSRTHIFERFYRLPLKTVERFYALRLTWADRFRLLVGNPPRGFSPRYRLTESTDR